MANVVFFCWRFIKDPGRGESWWKYARKKMVASILAKRCWLEGSGSSGPFKGLSGWTSWDPKPNKNNPNSAGFGICHWWLAAATLLFTSAESPPPCAVFSVAIAHSELRYSVAICWPPARQLPGGGCAGTEAGNESAICQLASRPTESTPWLSPAFYLMKPKDCVPPLAMRASTISVFGRGMCLGSDPRCCAAMLPRSMQQTQWKIIEILLH